MEGREFRARYANLRGKTPKQRTRPPPPYPSASESPSGGWPSYERRCPNAEPFRRPPHALPRTSPELLVAQPFMNPTGPDLLSGALRAVGAVMDVTESARMSDECGNAETPSASLDYPIWRPPSRKGSELPRRKAGASRDGWTRRP